MKSIEVVKSNISRPNTTLQRASIVKKTVSHKPPFYDLHDDEFYHGPAWVIKPRLFQSKEAHSKKPGPCQYHIPDRSVYARPGKTIGVRYENQQSLSDGLLAHYSPVNDYTSSAQMPAISIVPRRISHDHDRGYSGRFHLPSNFTYHCRTPILRPPSKPLIARKSRDTFLKSTSPGPTAYPMYEFDEDILPRSQPGFTQKHRFLRTTNIQTNPPFYNPIKADRHRIPSFTLGKRLIISKTTNHGSARYYTPFDSNASCRSGATLKGRWSPLINVMNQSPPIARNKSVSNHFSVTQQKI